MGGRGSASGAGNRVGRANKESFYTMAQNESYPQLTGSEKQIKWANDIRNDLLEYVDHMVENVDKAQKGEDWRVGDRAPSLDAAIQVRKDVINEMKQVTSAGQIIDARESLQSYARRTMEAYDRTYGTKFKRPTVQQIRDAERKFKGLSGAELREQMYAYTKKRKK